VYLLKNLAYLSLKNENHELAESRFKECIKIVPSITSSQISLMSAKRNMLLAYLYFDLDKAQTLAT
jgi:hypothetical protein